MYGEVEQSNCCRGGYSMLYSFADFYIYKLLDSRRSTTKQSPIFPPPPSRTPPSRRSTIPMSATRCSRYLIRICSSRSVNLNALRRKTIRKESLIRNVFFDTRNDRKHNIYPCLTLWGISFAQD